MPWHRALTLLINFVGTYHSTSQSFLQDIPGPQLLLLKAQPEYLPKLCFYCPREKDSNTEHPYTQRIVNAKRNARAHTIAHVHFDSNPNMCAVVGFKSHTLPTQSPVHRNSAEIGQPEIRSHNGSPERSGNLHGESNLHLASDRRLQRIRDRPLQYTSKPRSPPD